MAILAALAWVGLSSAAGAGVRFHVKSERADGSGGIQHMTIWVDGDRLAAEGRRPKAPPAMRRIVFRGSEDVLWFLDAAKNSYFQLDPESAKQTVAQIQGLRDGLAAGLEALGPENAARARELLGDVAAPPRDAPKPEVSLRAQGRSAVYAELSCARMDVLAGGRRVGEICLAGFGQGLLQRDRLAAVPAFAGFLERTLPPLLGAFPALRPLAPLASLAGADGVPIRARISQDGAEESVTTLRKAREVDVDPALFEIPEGWGRSWVPPF